MSILFKNHIFLFRLSLILLYFTANSFAKTSETDERLKQTLKRHPETDLNKDGILTLDEKKKYLKEHRGDQSKKKGESRETLAPTFKDVSYGDHEKQVFDIWLAKSKDGKPSPLVIFIHGGGFRGGDKKSLKGSPVKTYLDRGISFASMNYRLSDIGPYPIMMNDSARGLQYIRSRAKEWNLDSDHVACFGGSAGAGISLWLGFHEDLADPKSKDPVARQSTRIVAAGTLNGQSTYDMRTFKEWFALPDLKPHPALVKFYAVEKDTDWESDRVKKLMIDASAISHLTKDDVPVFMNYGKGDVPIDENSSANLWVHHARLGLKLKEAMDKLGLECHVTWNGNDSKKYKDIHAFLMAKVLAE